MKIESGFNPFLLRVSSFPVFLRLEDFHQFFVCYKAGTCVIKSRLHILISSRQRSYTFELRREIPRAPSGALSLFLACFLVCFCFDAFITLPFRRFYYFSAFRCFYYFSAFRHFYYFSAFRCFHYFSAFRCFYYFSAFRCFHCFSVENRQML